MNALGTIGESRHIRHFKSTLENPESHVRVELGMSHQPKGDGDFSVQSCIHSITQVSYHFMVFILARTVIGSQPQLFFSKCKIVKEVMQIANHTICSLASSTAFRHQVDNHFVCWFTCNTKQHHFVRCQEIDRSYLL